MCFQPLKMMRLKFIFFIALLPLFFSCGSQSGPRPTIPLVKDIVARQEFTAAGSQGGIYIIGESERVLSLRDKFLTADFRDNITGRLKRDSIPDFAGEVFCCVLDSANLPYGRFIIDNDNAGLREVAVYNAVAALDSISHLSPYDDSGRGRKTPAKMIIYASPELSNCGVFDVDTLARLSGSSMPVGSMLDAMCLRLFKTHKGDLSVGVITKSGNLGSGSYSTVIRQYARLNGRRSCNVTPFAVSADGDPLREFLDKYIDSGNTAPLDALLVDDENVDTPSMIRSLGNLRSIMSSDFLVYDKYLSPSFDILDGEMSAIQWCYHALRDNNLFSHRISLPSCENFYTAVSPVQGSSPFIMISLRTNVQK